MRVCLSLLVLLLTACGGSGGGGGGGGGNTAPPPAPPVNEVELEPAFTQLSFAAPMALVQAPDSAAYWYLAEREGRVWRFAADDSASTASLVIDISATVSTAGEGGLLSMAFHPGFADNGYVFLSYTAPLSPLESRVSRFTSSDGGQSLDSSSEQLILRLPQDAQNHNGGDIAFGPDGMLYLALGDGGGADDPRQRAQDTTNLLGGIVRIDIDSGLPYTIPTDNPFAGNPLCAQGFGSADCPELFAWGLRNPWRISFDRGTGDLWTGDVGQGAREEINLVQAGGNYGWPRREGSICNPGLSQQDCDSPAFVDPVLDYEHDQGRSVTGGYVYRGDAIEWVRGSYLFADFISGRVWRLDPANPQLLELLDTELRFTSFGQANSGELYLLELDDGGIYRLLQGGD